MERMRARLRHCLPAASSAEQLYRNTPSEAYSQPLRIMAEKAKAYVQGETL
jgi:hypothetical protein